MKICIDRAPAALHITAEIEKSEPRPVRSGLMHWQGIHEYSNAAWTTKDTPTTLRYFRKLPRTPWAYDSVCGWLRSLPEFIGDVLGTLQHAQRPADGRYANIEIFIDSVPVANMAELPTRLTDGDEVHSLGSFHLDSGTLRVTDPCYRSDNDACSKLSALPGIWESASLTGPTNWYHRVKELRVWNSSLGSSADIAELFAERTFELAGVASVDSAQCGFFDDARYPTSAAEFEYDNADGAEHTYYRTCCELTLNKGLFGGGVLPSGIGVVSSSGFGDGGYRIRVKKNPEGLVVAAVVEYISKKDPAEDA